MARRGEASTVADETAAADGARTHSPLWDGAVALLALVGLVDAGYLTTEHLAGRIGNVPCMVTTDCGGVLTSSYATLPGDIPLAALGALAYFTAFSLATLAAFGYASARTLLLPLVLTMFGASLWLLYLQAFVLEAFCSYCLLSAAISTTMTILLVVRHLLRKRRGLS